MIIPTRHLKSGFSMPAIGKGTWMTNIKKKKHSTIDEVAWIEEIKAAIDSGITYIDTAERYADGHIEKLIGQAIKGYPREKLFLASKVSSNNLGYEDVILSAKKSIKRLGTSYLDLYLIHQFNPKISLQETMRAMDYLIEKKLVKNIGVCDFTVEQIEEAQRFTNNKIVANEFRFNFMNNGRQVRKIVDYCIKNEIMVIAWRPFSEDLLTKDAKALLGEMSQKYAKSPSQIAIAWLASQECIVVLVKFGLADHIKEVIGGLNFKIDTKDLEKLNITERRE